MQNGGFVSWDEWKPILNGFNCPCCMGAMIMPTEEELEQRVTDHIDRESVASAILQLEIKQMNIALQKTKAVGNSENVSGLSESERAEQGC